MSTDNSIENKKGLYTEKRFFNIYLFFLVLGLQFFMYLFLGNGWGLTEWFFLGMGIFSTTLWGYFWIINAGFHVPKLDKAFRIFFKSFDNLLNISAKLLAAIVVLLLASVGLYFFFNAAVAIPVQVLLLIVIFILLFK